MKARNAKMEKEFGVKTPESSFLETPKLTSKEQFTQLLARMHEAAVDMKRNANAWKSGKTASFLETSARAEDDKVSDDRWAKVGSSLDHLEQELRSNKQNWHQSLDIPASLAEIRRQSAKYRSLKAQLQAQQADTEATSLLQDHQETASDEQARNELRAFEQGMAKEYAALPAAVKAKQTSLLETAKRNRFYGADNKEVEEDRIAEMQGFEDGGKADLAAIARSPQEQLRKEIQDTQYSIGQ